MGAVAVDCAWKGGGREGVRVHGSFVMVIVWCSAWLVW